MSLLVRVDWQNNGTFTDSIDDISADVMDISWRVGMRQAFQPLADEMTLKITVKNADGKYIPENGSSTLYGYILPNRRAQVAFVDGGGTSVMWTGFLDFPQIAWEPAGTATAKISINLSGVGPKTLLEDDIVNLRLYEDVTGDEIIQDVLDQSSFAAAVTNAWVLGIAGRSEIGSTTTLADAADYSALDTGTISFEYYGDLKPDNGWKIIEDVTLAERGRFFFDRSGVATWWNRYHLLNLTDNDGTVATNSSNKPTALDYTYGTQLANVIRVESHPRQTSEGETLWSLDTTVTIPPAGTADFEIRLRRSSGQFAGASSLIATPTFSSGMAIVTVTPLGGKARVTAVNSDTGIPAIMTGLDITGSAVVQQNNLTVEVSDDTSIATYGRRVKSIDVGPMSDYATAKTMAEFELAQRKDARGEINWLAFVRQADGTGDAMLLDWPMGTRLLVDSPELIHSSDYFIIGEEHSWEPGLNGGIHTGKFYLEPADTISGWILGVTGRSEIGTTTTLV